MRRCKSRHRKLWILFNNLLWCYECGSLCDTTVRSPKGRLKWFKPVGPKGENPAVTHWSYDPKRHSHA